MVTGNTTISTDLRVVFPWKGTIRMNCGFGNPGALDVDDVGKNKSLPPRNVIIPMIVANGTSRHQERRDYGAFGKPDDSRPVTREF